MKKEDLDIYWHNEVFHLVKHEIRIRHKDREYRVETTTTGNDFAVRFWDDSLKDWRHANIDDKVETFISEMLDKGDYLVGESLARYK